MGSRVIHDSLSCFATWLKNDGFFAWYEKMGRVGHEHPPLTLSKTPISASGGAKSDARPAPKTEKDPDLVLVVERWPELSEPIKNAILSMVRTVLPNDES